MSQKAELPSLTGHRTKTRKRDEKKVKEIFLCKDYFSAFQVYDPSGFRDSVIEGLEQSKDEEDLGKCRSNLGILILMRLKTETPADLDAISKWLDIAGNKLDYRRYGEVIIKAIALSLSYLSLVTLLS